MRGGPAGEVLASGCGGQASDCSYTECDAGLLGGVPRAGPACGRLAWRASRDGERERCDFGPCVRACAPGADKPITDWRNCDDGSFKYMPRMGDAVLFWGVKPNGDIDPHSLHGGCPVKRGEK